ncbi:MAG: MFS transporter [Lentisphaerota bacterium]
MKTRFQAITIWLVATSFVIYELIVSNGFCSISSDLQTNDLKLSIDSIGLLAAVPCLAYALCQIPAGILVDKYSVKKVLSSAALLVSAGMGIYSFAQSVNVLLISQILISIGSAFAFISTAILVGRWFPKERFSLFFGITECLGNLSVVTANMFLPQLILYAKGWRVASLILAIIGIVVFISILLIVKCRPEGLMQHTVSNKPNSFKLFKELAGIKQYWIAVVFAGLFLGTLFNFSANWLISFQDIFDANNLKHSAMVNSLLLLGLTIGNPAFGILSLKLRARRKFLIIGSFLSMILLVILVLGPAIRSDFAIFLYFCFGLSSSSGILVYSVIMDILPPDLEGMGIGICNTVVYVSGAALSLIIAEVIKYESHLNRDLLTSNKMALSGFFISVAIAFCLSFLIKETFTGKKTAG